MAEAWFMKRSGNLWPQLTSWENLLGSALAAARGKRKRPDVARFLFNLEPNVCSLQRELISGEWRPGEYRTFWIHDPKPRMISAAPFRDRVVHHAITRVLESVFERRFTASSFASRRGFGQHKALHKARVACGRYRYALKCDIRKYFPSMDHLILKELLEAAIKCRPTLNLVSTIIDGSNAQEEVNALFPGDTLFTALERRKGLPIGNQTSQFFANVYLKRLHSLSEKFHRAEIDFADVQRRISAWLGHAAFGDTWNLRRKLFRQFILVGAERGRSARGFVEQ